MRLAIILFLILFSQSLSKADHILKEGVFKNDPVYHNDKKFILSCKYGESGKYYVRTRNTHSLGTCFFSL